jgi:uncharacterized protein (DUF305 family)
MREKLNRPSNLKQGEFMSKKFLAYSLVGLISSSAAMGVVLGNSKQGLSLPASGNPQELRSVRVDRHFIEMMIPHHQDAIAMADLALSRAKRPEVKKMAEAVKKAQTSEVQEMRTWYKQWYGKEVPVHARTDMGMMGDHHGQSRGTGSGMMGMGQDMMSMKTDLNALKQAPDFDREFVRQMIPHHQMAVKMAQMALERATHPEIRTLAQSIITSQSAEIVQMQGWQQAWNR